MAPICANPLTTEEVVTRNNNTGHPCLVNAAHRHWLQVTCEISLQFGGNSSESFAYGDGTEFFIGCKVELSARLD